MSSKRAFYWIKWRAIGRIPFGYSLTFNALLARAIRNKSLTYLGLFVCFIVQPFDDERRKVIATIFDLRRKGIQNQSQNLQDVAALYFCMKSKTYLDLGAAYAKKYSNSFLLQENNWKGVLVEPNDEFHSELTSRINEHTILIKAAIGLEAGKSILLNSGPLSSLNGYEEGDIYSRLRKNLSEKNGRKEVKVIAISELLAKEFPDKKIGYLSIDIAGMDVFILEEILINGYRPEFITIEHNFVRGNVDKIMGLAKEFSYRIICQNLSVQDFWLVDNRP